MSTEDITYYILIAVMLATAVVASILAYSEYRGHQVNEVAVSLSLRLAIIFAWMTVAASLLRIFA